MWDLLKKMWDLTVFDFLFSHCNFLFLFFLSIVFNDIFYYYIILYYIILYYYFCVLGGKKKYRNRNIERDEKGKKKRLYGKVKNVAAEFNERESRLKI